MLLTLLNPHSDIVKIRIDDPGIEPGNIPFDAAVDLYENARKLIAASSLFLIWLERLGYCLYGRNIVAV